MSVKRFLDTNILAYAYDLSAPVKRTTALNLLDEGWRELGSAAVSVQVLQELHVYLMRRGASQSDASRIVADYAKWPVIENTVAVLHAAFNEQARWKISLWDALILAAARASGATTLISEDLSHGQNYNGIRVFNPFK